MALLTLKFGLLRIDLGPRKKEKCSIVACAGAIYFDESKKNDNYNYTSEIITVFVQEKFA